LMFIMMMINDDGLVG